MLAVGVGMSVALVRAEREWARRGTREQDPPHPPGRPQTQDPPDPPSPPRAPHPPSRPQTQDPPHPPRRPDWPQAQPPSAPDGRPDERTAPGGLQGVVLEQLGAAVDLLESYPRRPAGEQAETVHEVRKALKRARALLRLLRPQLDGGDFERESVALRDCGRRLSGARDAEVMVATLDELVRRHPRKLAGSGGVRRLRRELAAERERATSVEDRALREEVTGELRAVRERVALWRLPGDGMGGRGWHPLERGLRDVYARGRRRRRRARRREDLATLHALRKSAKDLRYAAETLEGRTGTAGGAGAGSGAGGGKARRRMRRVARRADRLGEMLGEEHDLALLRGVVRERFDGGRRKRRLLLKLIGRRRRRLRRRSLALAGEVYGRKPRRFVGRLRRSLRP